MANQQHKMFSIIDLNTNINIHIDDVNISG